MKETFNDICIMLLALAILVLAFTVHSRIYSLEKDQKSLVKVIKLQSEIIDLYHTKGTKK